MVSTNYKRCPVNESTHLMHYSAVIYTCLKKIQNLMGTKFVVTSVGMIDGRIYDGTLEGSL